MTKRAVIYIRVSTDEQAEKGYSLPHQTNECRRYALLNGFSVIEEIADDFSGATLERPGFLKLREMVSQDQIDVVIVYTADRLSRNIIDFLVLRDQWEKAGIELHYVDRGKSQNNFEGLLTDGIFALIAHGERLKIIERTTNGRHNKARSNRVVMTGIPPYGYRKKGVGPDSEYVLDSFQAEVVKNIFDWYVNGYEDKGPLSLRGISNLLDQMGIEPPNNRTKRRAPFWHPETLVRVLKNTIYIGITYYGKVKTENGKRSIRPKEEWVTIKVPHLALVSQEIFEQAQKRMERNKELAKRNRKRAYLLSGFFHCATCGNAMTGYQKKYESGRKGSYYGCFAGGHKGSFCKSRKKHIVTKRVDSVIWEWVRSLLQDENNLDEGIRAMIERRAIELGPKKERLDTIESLLSDADAKIERLVSEIAEYEGYAVRDVIRQKIKEIESEKNMLLAEWERLTKELEQSDLSPDFEQQIRRTAEIIRKSILGATLEDKRRVLEALDLRVKYLFDEERGQILQVSCVIPFGEGPIELLPSPRLSH